MKLKKGVKRVLTIPAALLIFSVSNAVLGMNILIAFTLLVMLNVMISIEG